MDLVKIGKYIAGKRKALGMTQKQLAEKLNMSDKSVSKWERGICLPDVSVYMELCEILGISINEFLAGEDIDAENVEKKSEDNIIQVTKDSKKKQKNLKSILAVVTTFAVIMVLVLGAVFVHKVMQPKNYITAVDRTSAEMKTAELLSGTDGAYLFNFYSKEEYKTLTIYLSEYQAGELINKSKVADLDYDGLESAKRGVIAVIPDFELFRVKLIIADDYSKCSTDFPILENVENREYYGRSATQVEGEVPIQRDTEQGLMALIYGEDGLEAIPVKEMEQGNFREKNDYVYYLSFRFEK
ncbi:helix-turn-helix domain-containing protein [Ruminococcus sp. AM22-14LB]|jgi:transcriptional regulator with XRE-family HTH domain|uniref:helix-turn-helix domain-containing protein n=1 Tax=Mediterraneibacter faecis TaxID=592978 RepID=UPI000E406CE4|nr:helix-turn-helix domain-containing protein [Mediterraneibacter faecis]RGF03960.1 helix-turn-helix domain-containing protein [Ruminococcus sp. AM22-14LB]RGH16153.1 helix-turn-helix domain-containing protein [Ruminococcus sp. AF12-5]